MSQVSPETFSAISALFNTKAVTGELSTAKSAFNSCQGVEEASKEILTANGFLKGLTGLFGQSFSYIESPDEQEQEGDIRVINSDTGKVTRIELKAEIRHTGNLFLETWSNYFRDSEKEQRDKRTWTEPSYPCVLRQHRPDILEKLLTGTMPGVKARLGWLEKLKQVDLLVYHFLQNNQVYVISWPMLVQWMNTPVNGQQWMTYYRHMPMGKQIGNQHNRSWGALTKIEDVMNVQGMATLTTYPMDDNYSAVLAKHGVALPAAV